jgi:sec-independent protein translocase protein TatA
MYTSTLLFLNIGTQELMVIMFVVLLLFGGKKLPELARGLGKGIREFKDASDGVKREIHRNINAVNEEMDFEAAGATKNTSTTNSTSASLSEPDETTENVSYNESENAVNSDGLEDPNAGINAATHKTPENN